MQDVSRDGVVRGDPGRVQYHLTEYRTQRAVSLWQREEIQTLLWDDRVKCAVKVSRERCFAIAERKGYLGSTLHVTHYTLHLSGVPCKVSLQFSCFSCQSSISLHSNHFLRQAWHRV